jgi:hypothetical protein
MSISSPFYGRNFYFSKIQDGRHAVYQKFYDVSTYAMALYYFNLN